MIPPTVGPVFVLGVGLLVGVASSPGSGPETNETDGVRGLRLHEAGAFEGYTLIAPLTSSRVLLLDMQGRVVHRWETGVPEGGACYLLEGGRLLHLGVARDNPRFAGPGLGGLLRILDWDGEVLWSHVLANDSYAQHHDVAPLPNGNLLVLTWEARTSEEALAAGRVAGHVGAEGLWSEAVFELRPTGDSGAEVVWEWHLWDHLVQEREPAFGNHGSVAEQAGRLDLNVDVPPTVTSATVALEAATGDPGDALPVEALEQLGALGYVAELPSRDLGAFRGAGPGKPDWLHTNSIDHDPELDLIVLSSPVLNEVFVIDHGLSTQEARGHHGGRFGRGGDLLWRWGNPRNYGHGAAADQRLFHAHDASFLRGPDGDLRVLLFNNGGGRPGGEFSSVEELRLPLRRSAGTPSGPRLAFGREAGRPFGPEQPLWSYADPERFHSRFLSGAQRLPNGNTLICSGEPGRVFEVTADGRIVWDYLSPHEGMAPPSPTSVPPIRALFRATRFAPDHPALAGREL